MMMHACQHDDLVLFDHVEERVGKTAQHSTADFIFDALIQLGIGVEMRFRAFELADKCARLINL